MNVYQPQSWEALVWTDGVDMITYSTFSSSQYISVNSETGVYVTPVGAGAGWNVAVSWINGVTNTHRYVFTFGAELSQGIVPSFHIPRDPSR